MYELAWTSSYNDKETQRSKLAASKQKKVPLGCNKGTMYLTLGKTKASIQVTKQGGPVSRIKKIMQIIYHPTRMFFQNNKGKHREIIQQSSRGAGDRSLPSRGWGLWRHNAIYIYILLYIYITIYIYILLYIYIYIQYSIYIYVDSKYPYLAHILSPLSLL